MINIWNIYNEILLRANKEQSGRSFSVDQFNLAAQFVNFQYFKLKVGLPESYKPGMPIAPQMWQVSQKITDDMRIFLTWCGGPDTPLLQMDQWGVAMVPPDYIAFSSCYYNQQNTDICGNTELVPRAIEFLPDAVWADRLANPIKKPTEKYPVAKWFGSSMQFAPTHLLYVNFTYLREPVTPVLAVTIDSNNDYVYDPTNSVNFEFPQICQPDVENLLYKILGIQIQSQLDVQAAVQQQITGI